ncbi:MAG: hypothetical protein D6689_17345 [Deltaproteobacteria bacterium]|nr:MAG: hypothetical protein D6689_17345 [Deltaproteobacteria bacterium]
MTAIHTDAVASEAGPGDRPAAEPPPRHLAIICSKGSLDMAYPGLVLANAARMAGHDASLFFTFWGLDLIRKEKVDDLHVSTVGNPSLPIPTLVGGLPGMEHVTSKMMRKKMAELDIPPVREFLQILKDSGAKLYACELAMQMFDVKREDLIDEVDDVLTAMDFIDLTEGAQMLFV